MSPRTIAHELALFSLASEFLEGERATETQVLVRRELFRAVLGLSPLLFSQQKTIRCVPRRELCKIVAREAGSIFF